MIRLRDLLYRDGRRSMSVQGRLARITATGVALAVMFIGIATYFTARASLYSQLDQELVEPLPGRRDIGTGSIGFVGFRLHRLSSMRTVRSSTRRSDPSVACSA